MLKDRISTTACLVALVSAAACGGGAPEERAGEPTTPVDVQVAPASTLTMAERLESGGIVRALESATLASRVMAPIVAVQASPGDRVRRGQALVLLDAQQAASEALRANASVTAAERAGDAARASREAAGAALALASASHDRVAALHARRSATPQELDEAVAALKNAQSQAAGAAARVEEATAALASARAAAAAAATAAAYATIAAPFDGVVTEKLVEPGNLATPGMPLLRVDREGGHRVDVYLDETRAAAVAPGTAVTVVLPPDPSTGPSAEARLLETTVVEVARAVDVGERSVLVKVALPALDGVRSGTFVRVRFAGAQRSTIAVPETAVKHQGQVSTVFVVEGDVVRLRLVRTGAVVRAQVTIDAGLDAGERVVVAPPPGLVDGSAVRVTSSGGRS